MASNTRILSHEILDHLEPTDPRAMRSRRDLERINRFMGAPGILARALSRTLTRGSGPPRLLEVGAGDGVLTLRVARRLAKAWPAADLTLLDRQALLARTTGIAFAQLGWSVHTLTADVLEWAQAPMPAALPPRWDVVVANLFLHHFDDARLRELLAALAARCDALIALEPRRGPIALAGAHLLGALAVNAVSRHDGVLSVRAGFRERELSELWRAPGRWQCEEHAAGVFSHFFRATRLGSS